MYNPWNNGITAFSKNIFFLSVIIFSLVAATALPHGFIYYRSRVMASEM
jgi:hypothetical protein